MQETFALVLQHVRASWRYRWFIALVAWPLCILGWIYVHSLPDQYQASARVYLDTQSILRPLLSGLAVQSDARSEVDLMTRTLLSRPNLEKVARMTDLDLKAKTPEQMESLLTGMLGKIAIEDTNRRGLFRISYEDSDPQLAKRVVQALLTIFMENSLGESRKDTDVAQRFLDEQIKEYEARLVASEQRLTQFKRENLGRMPTEGRGYYDNLQASISELEQARLDLQEAENRRKELQRQLEDKDAMLGFAGPAVGGSITPELDGRIQALQSRLDELLLKYTDQHPDVQAVKNTMEDLKKQRAETVAHAKIGGRIATDGAMSPYQAQMQLTLSEADANIAALRARVGTLRNRVDELKKLVNIIPEVEAQLQQLNRDYDVTKSNYETLLARRESAGITQQLEQNADTVKFRVVDPPFVPATPSGPNRPLLSSGALGIGIAAGLVFAFFLSQLNPTYDSRRGLTESTQLPVLGGVSMIWTHEQRRRRRMELLGFSALMAGLLVVYGGLVMAHLFQLDVVSKLKSFI